jgi:hypothetical protein
MARLGLFCAVAMGGVRDLRRDFGHKAPVRPQGQAERGHGPLRLPNLTEIGGKSTGLQGFERFDARRVTSFDRAWPDT